MTSCRAQGHPAGDEDEGEQTADEGLGVVFLVLVDLLYLQIDPPLPLDGEGVVPLVGRPLARLREGEAGHEAVGPAGQGQEERPDDAHRVDEDVFAGLGQGQEGAGLLLDDA